MYRRDFDPQHEDDPDAPGLQGSNYFVKKTPHGDIRRNQPTGGGGGGGRRSQSSR